VGCRVVFEVAEAEIRQQRRAEGVSHARGQTVVVGDRAAGQSSDAGTDCAKRTKDALSGNAEASQAEAPEYLRRLTQVIVNASVEAILVERTASGRNEVVLNCTGGWSRKQLKHRQRLLRDPAHGNLIRRGAICGIWVLH